MDKKRYNLTSVQIMMTINGKQYIVGGAESAKVIVNQATETAHEANSKTPAEIVDGKMTVKGTISRAQIDFMPHNVLLNKTGDNPEFQITAIERISKKTINVYGCKITGDIGADIALDSYAKDEFSFEALDWNFSPTTV